VAKRPVSGFLWPPLKPVTDIQTNLFQVSTPRWRVTNPSASRPVTGFGGRWSVCSTNYGAIPP